MAQTICADLSERQQSIEAFFNNETLINNIFDSKLSDQEIEKATTLPFYVYAYMGDSLIFWNTNKTLANCVAGTESDTFSLFKNDRGVFLKKCLWRGVSGTREKIVVLLPVAVKYPFENNYLKSRFLAADYIPVSTEVMQTPEKGSYPVMLDNGQTVFHLLFNETDIQPWQPDTWMLVILIAALFTTIFWLNLITIQLINRKKHLAVILLTFGVTFGFRGLNYIYSLPFNLDDLTLFSPQLYATSGFLPSLGDLLLNAFAGIWIGIVILKYLPEKPIRTKSSLLNNVLGVLLSLLLILYIFWFTDVIRSLVIDSRISFDVVRFNTINGFTVMGLFTITVLTGLSCMLIYIFNRLATDLLKNDWLWCGITGIIGLLYILAFETGQHQNPLLVYFILGWLVLFLLLMNIRQMSFVNDLFAPQMIFWAVYLCAFMMILLQQYNRIKERETRKIFAERLLQQRDDVTEYTFQSIAANIRRDNFIHAYLQSPSKDIRRIVDEHFDAIYLGGQLNSYQSEVYLFDDANKPLYNIDTTSYHALLHEFNNAMPTGSEMLRYKEYAQDGHFYLAYIPVYDDTDSQQVGSVFIDLAIKQEAGESVYPELLQPGNIKGFKNEAGYTYGIYVNGKLLTQSGGFSFPALLLQQGATDDAKFYFRQKDNVSELWYTTDNNKTAIISYDYRMSIESITLFSYLFGFQLLFITIVLLYRIALSYFLGRRIRSRLINLTLRRRIHYSMLSIVLVSFLIIGAVTTAFFTRQYKDSNRARLQTVMQTIEKLVRQYMTEENALTDKNEFKREAAAADFKYFITNLANSQKVDVNIYNADGRLAITSQEDIYDKALLARVMKPEAYYQLSALGSPIWIQNETIGKLSYQSFYVPVRNLKGVTIGYINVPFFSSEKELNFQISNILIVLINLYAFFFLVSGGITIVITRWLTRILNVIIEQFERLNFSKNERIQWPYNDEIGVLVKEYNKMIQKVEENAILLAQSERESAWREMARQVAHEIKNPLTPMKLNIQYLQQALKKDQPNVKELTVKVADSLIEQIDNLSYIASEFSNFAKMPEARPEDIELNELLEKVVELYLDKERVKVNIEQHKTPLWIHADRSQMLRIFTNLLENAVQAIPDERDGIISVRLHKEDGHATIAFEDNGTGIEKEVRESIFQPYFTTKSSGTGLGLAMTKKILEFWKGAIWFETEMNKGTTFFVQLPLKEKL